MFKVEWFECGVVRSALFQGYGAAVIHARECRDAGMSPVEIWELRHTV